METQTAPEIQSLRYRAVMRLAYSVALLRLMEYSRESKASFEFGPMNLDALENQGLVISGDVAGAAKMLAGVEGLFLSDE